MLSSASLNRRRRRRQPPFNDTTFSGSEAEDSPVRGQHKPRPPLPPDAFKRAAENAANGGLPGISALNTESRPGGAGGGVGFSRRNLFTADDPQTGVVDSELTTDWSRFDSAAVRTTMKSSRRTVRTEDDGGPVQQQMTDGVPVRPQQQVYFEKRLELRREEEEVVTSTCTSLRNRQVSEGENEVPLLKTPEQKNRDLDWR